VNDYQEEKAAMLAWLEKYGTPTRVDSVDISSVNPHQVWTEWWRDGQFIVNGYTPVEEGIGGVWGYYITPNPWSSDPGSETVITVIWQDCYDCDVTGETEDGGECPACEGSSIVPISFI
jgi:hypothetical protein